MKRRDETSDLGELRALMVDFTPEQQAAVLEAASQAALHARGRVVADRVLADCPPAPPCASWCTVEHEDMHKGWEAVETHGARLGPYSAQKDCYAQLGFAECDDGTIAVELHRIACVDNLGSRWDGLYVGDETVSMHPDNEFSRMNAEQLSEFLAILERGADTLSASKNET